jgi:hypothetical protein
LEVFQSLLARTEQSSAQCLSSRKELQAKCCGVGTYDDNNVLVPSPDDNNATVSSVDKPAGYAPVPSPGVDWSPSVDEPAGYPTEGFYYTKPDWNENWNSCSRITSTATASALLSISWVMWQ